MSVVLIEGFDQYRSYQDLLKVPQYSNITDYWSTAPGYKSGRYIKKKSAAGNGLCYSLNRPVQSGIIGFWFYTGKDASMLTDVLLSFPATPSVDMYYSYNLRYSSSRNLFIESYSLNTITNLSPSLLLNTWYHVELQYQISNSTTIPQKIRLNGTEVCSSSIGIDTLYNSNDGSFLSFHTYSPGITSDNTLGFDHLYLLNFSGDYNNNFIGPNIYIQTLEATGNGDTNQWSTFPATGNAWDLIKEAYIDTTGTYVYTSISGERETYKYPLLSGNVQGIKAVAESIAAIRSGDFNMSLKHVVNTNTTMASSGLSNIVFATHTNVYEINPDTSLPWTTGQLASSQFGFELHYTGV